MTILTLYLFVSFFLLGGFAGADWAQMTKREIKEYAALIGLALVWPFTALLIIKMAKEGKL